MNSDKNTVIGMVLLAILFAGFFYFTNKQQQANQDYQKQITDSTAKIEAAKVKPVDTVELKKLDTANKLAAAGSFTTAALGTEQLVTVENEVIKATFTNKGGAVKQVELKNYKSSYNNKPVVLGGSAKDNISYSINTGNNATSLVSNLYFKPLAVVKNADGSQTLSFSIAGGNGQVVTHVYTIKPNNYLIDWNINLTGADQLLTNGNLNITWNWQTKQAEKTAMYERQMSNICFSEGGDFDYISQKKEHKFEKQGQWIGVVQQFFNTTVIAKNGFNNGNINWTRSLDEDTTNTLATLNNTSFSVTVPAAATAIVPFALYFGPNDYKTLQSAAPNMDKIVNLGRDMYAFVRPINVYIIKNVFNFFISFITNYGWAILMLTLFIRLFTAPLMYGSYLSGAKMKALRPELDGLKKKFGDDKQGFTMEQMKLFREAGVNPLGGCIPGLLQIPIFFALYSFFNSNISLRSQSFLWSDDLSAYDVIAKLPFSIPLGFGDHISLFTITAVLTNFAISLYNMGNTPTQDNPAMKYMPYIFPFMMLFIFNSLPSALTWYYTVSNTITLLLQFVIQTYIIDHDKILSKIQESRSKPKVKTKSKWQERYEQVMESQKKVQELKNKTQNKK
ncbi:MAG: membrane protein insertase YidC [Flavobacterium sp.]|nr:membrane protein insertase YidC [Flavobacterium sp.]